MTAPVLKVYLGDGLYGEFDGCSVELRAPREGGDHYVVLDPEVMASFLTWVTALTLAYPELAKRWGE